MIKKTCLAASISAFGLMVGATPAHAQSSPPVPADVGVSTPTPTPTPTADAGHEMQTVVVTGQTTKGRKLLTATSDTNVVTNEDIQEKAPRNLASLLEMVPGVFVENSAGNINNNVEVRGLPGGSSFGVGWEEDGMPWRYAGDNDNYFSVDLNVDHAEAVRGGASTVLSVTGAGVLFNIITKKPNFDKFEGAFRVGGATYNDKRADIYVTGPISDRLAFNAGGYVESTKGQRDSVFTYKTYHVKGALEYKLPGGGTIDLSLRRGDQSDPYYADMPFQVVDGKTQAVPGMNPQFGNMNGAAFGNISVPGTYVNNPSGLTNFSLATGSRIITNSARLDMNLPVTENLSFHSKTRYTTVSNNANFIYPGAVAGSGGLAPASDYLDMESATSWGGYGGKAPWPVGPVLNSGYDHFGNVAQFGIRNLQTGAMIPASNTAALNALNGNGLLQMSTISINHDTDVDFGTNNFVTWDSNFGNIHNSLTAGLMFFQGAGHQNTDGSGTGYLTDVRSNAATYDIVALDGSNKVLGAVTNNGAVTSQYWSSPTAEQHYHSAHVYFNNEMQIGKRLYIDFGVRREDYTMNYGYGGLSWGGSPNQLAAGASSWMSYWGPLAYLPAWDGKTSYGRNHFLRTPFTLGSSYLLTDNVAVYGRLSQGYEDDIVGPTGPLAMRFYEVGTRYHSSHLNFSADVFEAVVKNWNLSDFNNNEIPAADQALYPNFQSGTEFANYKTPGIEFDADYRPFENFGIAAQTTFQRPQITDTLVVATYGGDGTIVKVPLTGLNAYKGNVPQRTPQTIFSIKPSYYFSENKGSLYAIYHYNGRIYADSANNLPLPGYGRTQIGLSYNLTPKINFTATVDNVFNVLALTEGNPRQGSKQQIVNGYFYGRSIPGRNSNAYLTVKF